MRLLSIAVAAAVALATAHAQSPLSFLAPPRTNAVAAAAPGSAPTIDATGALNAARHASPVSPGSLALLTGNFLLTYSHADNGGAMPTSMAGVKVTFNGTVDAPLAYVSGSQIMMQIPWELAGTSSASVTVDVDGRTSAVVPITLTPIAPGVFSTNGMGFGQGVVVNQQNRIVDRTHPAVPGTTQLHVYCTGLGPTANAPATGAPAGGGAAVNTALTITVGGTKITSYSATLVAGSVGLYDVSFILPVGVVGGDEIPLTISAGGVTSNTVTIAVNAPSIITSVTPVLAQGVQTFTITGSGFGTRAAYVGSNTDYIQIENLTQKWSAGHAFDPITLSVSSWSDASIVVTGFNGAYGSGTNVLKAGDTIVVRVWNAQTGKGPGTYTLPVGQWQLVWSDEFNGASGTAPDATKWTYDTGTNNGWGNHELENYTSDPANAHMDGDGHLDIHVVNTNPGVVASGSYTSARLKTQNRFNFTYGRAEASVKLPYGTGIWPAFWMLGQNIETVDWPFCDEIDIMENIGKTPDTVYGTAHGIFTGQTAGDYRAWGRGGQAQAAVSGALSSGYHLYAVEWSPTAITFFLDGVPYSTVVPNGSSANPYPNTSRVQLATNEVWAFSTPNFLLLNVAVGGDWPGPPDATTRFPQDMLVDYVRIYQTGAAFIPDKFYTSVAASGATFSVNVTLPATQSWTATNTAWTAKSNASWLTVGAGASGTGAGSVSVVAAPNFGAARTGSLEIAGQTVFVTQAAN